MWPHVYELPRMPAALAAELNSAESVLSLTPAGYHSVVRILYEDLLQYTLWVVCVITGLVYCISLSIMSAA